MDSKNTNERALVLYQPKRNPLKKFTSCGKLCSKFADKLFSSRKKLYIVLVIFTTFGTLLGSYYASVCDVVLTWRTVLYVFGWFIPFLFITGFSVFGMVCAPLLLTASSFLCGCFFADKLFTSAGDVLRFGFFLLFYMLLLLFDAEVFLTSKRFLKGWRAVLKRRSFALYCVSGVFLFVIWYGLYRFY